eukprot:TRINITY_DN3311_c0_g1_i1.p1 TRINITY_DN3311_c0_g1~~TRINITY_DN3311_c0_g1_i1.p1  ORF type:complete len:276 (+),score=61.57 TRINITY_DN3311_c0_g1_i1:193-1020(+)
MEKSASAPSAVLPDSDYYLPCNGVGETGLSNRTTHGAFSKDTGVHSSRINQIIKQAGKYPGPGKYVAHQEWDGQWGCHGGNKFGSGNREYKPMHKYPDPRHYENKDIFSSVSNASKEVLSTNHRILHGKIPKGKRRSFLAAAEKQALAVPSPGHYQVGPLANKLPTKNSKMTDWSRELVKTVGRGKKVESIAPNHYKPGWTCCEESVANYSVPKEKAANFLDKAVKEKMVSVKDKLPLPGPGAYDMQNFDFSKTSRGAYQVQIRGLTRCPASGYF